MVRPVHGSLPGAPGGRRARPRPHAISIVEGRLAGITLPTDMQIAITGGCGFLGPRVARALLADPRVERLVLADVAPARPFPEDARVALLRADLSQAGMAESVAEGADVIFHLAAVLSGQAEADFDLGMSVNRSEEHTSELQSPCNL